MAISKRRARKSSGKAAGPAGTGGHPPVLYVHGIGDQPAPDKLKREWDLALFGREMGDRTRMAYWSDILHGDKSPRRARATRADSGANVDALLAQAGVASDSDEARIGS